MGPGRCHACGSTHVGEHALQLSVPVVFGHMQISWTGAPSLCFKPAMLCLHRGMTYQPVRQSVREPSDRPKVRGGCIVETLPLQRGSQRVPLRTLPLQPAAAHRSTWIGCQSLGRKHFNAGLMLWMC